MAFVAELHRRQVFRAAAWYGGLAWLAVEVADTVFPRFGLPEWSVRAVIVAAVLGLPVALALGIGPTLSAQQAWQRLVPCVRREARARGAAVRRPEPQS